MNEKDSYAAIFGKSVPCKSVNVFHTRNAKRRAMFPKFRLVIEDFEVDVERREPMIQFGEFLGNAAKSASVDEVIMSRDDRSFPDELKFARYFIRVLAQIHPPQEWLEESLRMFGNLFVGDVCDIGNVDVYWIFKGFGSVMNSTNDNWYDVCLTELTKEYSKPFLHIVVELLELFHSGKVWPEVNDEGESSLRALQNCVCGYVLFRSLQPSAVSAIVCGVVSYMSESSQLTEQTNVGQLCHGIDVQVEYTADGGGLVTDSAECVYYQVGSAHVKRSVTLMYKPSTDGKRSAVAHPNQGILTPRKVRRTDAIHATKDHIDSFIDMCEKLVDNQTDLQLIRSRDRINADLEEEESKLAELNEEAENLFRYYSAASSADDIYAEFSEAYELCETKIRECKNRLQVLNGEREQKAILWDNSRPMGNNIVDFANKFATYI